MPGIRGILRSKQQDVRLMLPGLRHSFVAVGGLADYFKFRFGLQQPTEAVAKDRVIIRYNDTHRSDFAIHRIHTLSEEP